MYQLLETIRVSNRQLQNIALHNERLNRSRKEIWGEKKEVALENIIQIPTHINNDTFKCRVLYGKEIEKIEFMPYQIRHLERLVMVNADNLRYAHKFADRQDIEKLVSPAMPATDILIIQKNLVRDTSYGNIVFFDGEKYLTPAEPLLRGTKRAFLLGQGLIAAQEIEVQDLKNFHYAKIINAMIALEESPIIPIENIAYQNKDFA